MNRSWWHVAMVAAFGMNLSANGLPAFSEAADKDSVAANARACAESIGAHWDMRALKKWADPSYLNLINTDSGQTEKMFGIVKEKLGDLKSIKAMKPGLRESSRALYYFDTECQNAPAKLRLEMVSVPGEKKWKLRAINFGSKALSVAPVNKEILAKMKDYVDSTIPRLGRSWSFEEFKAEADPRILDSNEALAQKRFATMTNFIGPVITYKVSQLAHEGIKNSTPFATYKAFFNGNNCEGVALITVVYKDDRCRIAALNFGKKPPGGAAKPTAPNATSGSGLMPGGFLPGPSSLPANSMPAPFFDQNPELRGQLDGVESKQSTPPVSVPSPDTPSPEPQPSLR